MKQIKVALLSLSVLALAACSNATPPTPPAPPAPPAPAAGTLDSGFAQGGKLMWALGNEEDTINAVAVQNDGKVLVAGWTRTGGAPSTVVARYLPNGQLDTSFASAGKFLFDGVGVGKSDGVYALLVQPDGKILISGDALGQSYDLMVVRLEASGALDKSFGVDGKVLAGGSATETARAMTLDAQGRILVGGYSQSGSVYRAIIHRFNAGGKPDGSFGNNGVVTLPDVPYDAVRGLAVQTDGKIVAMGNAPIAITGQDFFVVRLHDNGNFDANFGTSGAVTLDIQDNSADIPMAMALDAQGRILVAGETVSAGQYRSVVVRLNSSGALDPNFGNGGKAVTEVGAGASTKAMKLDAFGRVILAGNTYSEATKQNFYALRYSSAGVLDSSFGEGGKVVIDLGNNDLARAMTLDTEGKVVLAGHSNAEGIYKTAIVRLHP